MTNLIQKVKNKATKFLSDTRGQLSSKFIGLAVSILILAYTLPMAITALVNANTTGWATDLVAIWDALPVITVLGAFIMIVAYAVLRD